MTAVELVFTTEYTEITEKNNCWEIYQQFIMYFGGGNMFIDKVAGDFSTQALELCGYVSKRK